MSEREKEREKERQRERDREKKREKVRERDRERERERAMKCLIGKSHCTSDPPPSLLTDVFPLRLSSNSSYAKHNSSSATFITVCSDK